MEPKQRKPQRVDAKKLAEIHNVSTRQVRSWVANGLRHGSKKNPHGGKRLWTFDNERDVLPWLAKNGIVTDFVLDQAHYRVCSGNARNNQSDTKLDTKVASEPGILGSLERLKAQEFDCAKKLVSILKDSGSRPGEIDAMQRLYIKQQEALRKGEIAAVEFRLRSGELVQMDGVRQTFNRLATATVNSMLGVGHNVIPKLRRYMSNPDDAPKVRKIIDAAIKEALRQLQDFFL